jgi:hypothetical protein
MKELV